MSEENAGQSPIGPVSDIAAMMAGSGHDDRSAGISAPLGEWLDARSRTPALWREMALALARIVDAGGESSFAAYEELRRVMDRIRRHNRTRAREAAAAPEADVSAVSESARDLVALVGAYGRGDEDAFNAMVSALEVGELRSLLSVACGLLRQCELRMGKNLRVRPDDGTGTGDGDEGV
ncbi:hypothetical protein ABZ690_17865 [Streptomyces sp. NPDC006967]|uniref:hypothetical protein n=1 Tax=unclassified Streptomyces TaxID=2593676 RepID=UPI0033D17F63